MFVEDYVNWEAKRRTKHKPRTHLGGILSRQRSPIDYCDGIFDANRTGIKIGSLSVFVVYTAST